MLDRLRPMVETHLPFLDFLPLEDERLPDYWRRVRWGQGRTLLKAARIMRRDLPGLEMATLTYEGLQSTHTDNRLQAFMTQVASRPGPRE